MLDILAISGPIYFSIAIGFFTTRFGLFAKTDRRVFAKFVINLAAPALLFKAVAERPIAEILNVNYILAYLLGTLALIGLGMFWCRYIARLDQTSSAFCTMGMACSNSTLMGYPVLLLTVPTIAGVAMALVTCTAKLLPQVGNQTLSEAPGIVASVLSQFVATAQSVEVVPTQRTTLVNEAPFSYAPMSGRYGAIALVVPA